MSTFPPPSLSCSCASGVSPATLSPKSLSDLLWTFGSNYIIPIILNAVQLATASFVPSSNTATLIESAKVVLNIAGASVAALRKQLPVLVVQAPSQMKEGLSHLGTKVSMREPSLDVNEATKAAHLVSEETADPTEGETKESTS